MKKYLLVLALILNFFSSYDLKANGCSAKYDYILFDLDRTLLDFDASENYALDKIYKKYFNHINKTDFIHAYHEVNSGCWKSFEKGEYTLSDVRNKRFQVLLDKLKINNLDPLKVENDYELYLAENADWLPETKDHFFKISENYNISIITNGYQLVQGARINKSGIQEVADHVFTSETIGHSKPSLLYFEHIFNEMKIDPQKVKLLIVGDSLSSDYQSALNIKADFCWVNPKSDPLPEKYSSPNCVVKNIKELHEIVSPPILGTK